MRTLTADTIIKVKKPRPPLTGDTKIRLSQIVDLKDWALEMAQDEAAPDGTIHHWSDGDHIKENGKWVPFQNKMQKEEEHTERQLASRYEGAPEEGYLMAYIQQLYGDNHTCVSIKEFVKKSNAQEYKKGTPIITSTGENIEPRITEGLQKLKELTGGEFDNVVILDSSKGMWEKTIAEVYPARPFNKSLLINKEHPYWIDERERAKLISNASTDLEEHLFLHEYAHRKLAPLPKKWDNDEDDIIASRLGNIATRSPDEFQSELYAAKHAGINIDKELIDLYERYGGDYASI